MAFISRVSTINIFNRTTQDINDRQASLFDLQNQISSGLTTSTFEGLSPKTEQFTNLEARIRKLETYQNNNAQAISRLETSSQALDRFIQIADDIEDLMVLRRSATGAETINFENQLRAFRESLSRELNISVEGRYLFGGTRTNIPPVITEPVPESVVPGTADTVYYQGSDEDIILRADDEYTVAYNVRADDEGFQNIYAAMSYALEGHAQNDDNILVDSLDLMQQGIQEVIALQSDINVNLINLTGTNERHQELQLYWQGLTEELINTDILTASTKVTQDQSILQATFQVFARVNSLTLSDFLN